MVTIVECATMWAPDYMLNYQKNMESTTDIDVYINNGAYYDLAGYTFVYWYMYDENKNLIKYWQCINYEAHVLVRGREDLETITRGELIVMHKLGEI